MGTFVYAGEVGAFIYVWHVVFLAYLVIHIQLLHLYGSWTEPWAQELFAFFLWILEYQILISLNIRLLVWAYNNIN